MNTVFSVISIRHTDKSKQVGRYYRLLYVDNCAIIY